MLVKATLLFVEMALNVMARNFACIFFSFFGFELLYFLAAAELLRINIGVIVNDFLDDIL